MPKPSKETKEQREARLAREREEAAAERARLKKSKQEAIAALEEQIKQQTNRKEKPGHMRKPGPAGVLVQKAARDLRMKLAPNYELKRPKLRRSKRERRLFEPNSPQPVRVMQFSDIDHSKRGSIKALLDLKSDLQKYYYQRRNTFSMPGGVNRKEKRKLAQHLDKVLGNIITELKKGGNPRDAVLPKLKEALQKDFDLNSKSKYGAKQGTLSKTILKAIDKFDPDFRNSTENPWYKKPTIKVRAIRFD